MIRSLAAATAAVFLVAGCGDDDDEPAAAPPPGAALNPAMSGTWTGPITVSIPGVGPLSTSLVIAVSGQTATVSGICPGGSGSVTAVGSGNSAQWDGTFACPPVATGQCAAVTLTHQSATLTLNANGTLTASTSSNASGCGLTSAVTLTFTGTK